ncbi:Zinc finger and SCAN domain-containing protein 20 [Scomber scombrus]|uniref:Zinc finger and SCAN domain-containing protein 20 n=1 Tax=Scomber scombrus TaxID=13677 RepID=A0AAV1PM21_SCOSC
MDKTKQQWSEEETQCFLVLWSSAEVQTKLDGACRTKPVFQNIQQGMVEAGYQRSVDQLINKLKKLKKDYRDQKKKLERSGSGRSKIMPFFDLMHGVLGDRPANQATGALNSATAMLELMLVDESVLATSNADPGKLCP